MQPNQTAFKTGGRNADSTPKLGPIVGIDFGSSNSCIAVWDTVKNRAKIIKNAFRESECSWHIDLFVFLSIVAYSAPDS